MCILVPGHVSQVTYTPGSYLTTSPQCQNDERDEFDTYPHLTLTSLTRFTSLLLPFGVRLVKRALTPIPFWYLLGVAYCFSFSIRSRMKYRSHILATDAACPHRPLLSFVNYLRSLFPAYSSYLRDCDWLSHEDHSAVEHVSVENLHEPPFLNSSFDSSSTPSLSTRPGTMGSDNVREDVPSRISSLSPPPFHLQLASGSNALHSPRYTGGTSIQTCSTLYQCIGTS